MIGFMRGHVYCYDLNERRVIKDLGKVAEIFCYRLALGADGVLIGRPYVTMVYGAGAEGVAVYTQKLIDELKDQLQSCVKALDRIKAANLPVSSAAPSAFDFERSETPSQDPEADAVAAEIAANLQALVGTTEDTAPKAEPRHPQSETTSKFTNLQFGRNYDPTHK